MHSLHGWHAQTGLSTELQGTPGAYSCARKLYVRNRIFLLTTLAGDRIEWTNLKGQIQISALSRAFFSELIIYSTRQGI